MTTTLPLFWHLSSASKKERIDASVKLVGSLEQFQAQFTQKAAPAVSASDDEDEDEDSPSKSDGLDLLNAQDVSYSIRRLVRGLASSRESSRLGFAVALTELLSRIDTVTCAQILSIIVESTKNQGSTTGQEERDILFAQLFGILSVVQSGLAVRTKPLPTSASSSTSASSAESYEEIITRLVELGEKKSWLRESAWFALSLAVDTLHESDATWKDTAVERCLQILYVDNTIWSTEKVAMALKLQDLYPRRDWKALLSPTFKNGDILSSGNLSTLSRILKESTTDEDGAKDPSKAPSGTWKPQLNFAWDIILDQMLPNSTKPAKGSFQDFYRIVVDESLFSSTSSPQRKFWGFQVFQKSLKRVNEDTMPMLFTKNFMRSWINHLSKKDRYLHKVAQQTAAEVQTFVEGKPHLGFALILQLTGINGSQQFDRLTKTKTVESILSSLDAKGIQNYIDHLMSQIDEPEGSSTDIQATNSRRSWVIEQLGSLIRNGRIPKEDGWVLSILNWLVVHGLFIIKKKSSKSSIAPLRSIPSPAFSDDLRKACRLRLLTCLSDLSSQTTSVKQDDKVVKISAVASDGEFWISKVLNTVKALEEDKKHVELVVDIDEEESELFQKAQNIVTKLRTVTGEGADSAKGAELLLLGTLLELYCSGDDDESADVSSLEACIDAASRMLLPEKKKSKDVSEEEDEPVDVIVDTIIGFLEKSTAYMRTVGNQVFSLLSGSLKESTIDLIVTQLERKNPAQLMEDDEEDMDEDGEDEGEEGEEAVEDDDEDNEESEESDGEDSGDDSNEEEADLELRNKIEEALRVNGIEPATGETDSEDEELMNDDQMMAIDEQLVQVFRSQAKDRKSGKNVDLQREATHFKNRVLDLVDSYLKKQLCSPLGLRFITPLIDLVSHSSKDEKQLSDKARGIVRSRFGKAKDIPTDIELDQVLPIITNIHTLARKAPSTDLLSLFSLCSIYLAKVMVHLKAEDALVDMYRQSLVEFATKKNPGLNSQFLQDFIRRYPALGWRLRKDLLEFTTKSKNAYRERKILVILELLLSLLPSISDCNDEVVEYMPLLRESLVKIVTDSLDQKSAITTQQVKEMSKLALLAVRQTRRISPAKVQSIWEPQSWRTLQERVKTEAPEAAALQKMCEQIARSAELAAQTSDNSTSKASKPSKRKAEEVAGDDNEEEAPVAKVSKRKKVKGEKKDRA
ncbi:hypothetical protein CPC08DRAFT_114924 [Agrocybe pediades]|nr:hypothetical protein CPC08DRAFT_114924 [Agrocybe pediades]